VKPFIKPKSATPEPASAPKVTPNELTILTVASGIADADERAAYLDRVCGDDSTLRARITERLAARGATPTTTERAELVRTVAAHAPTNTVAIVPMSGMTLSATQSAPRQSPFPWVLATILAAGIGALAVFFVNEKDARVKAETSAHDAARDKTDAEREREDAQAKALEARTIAERTEQKRAEADRQREDAEKQKAAAIATAAKSIAEAEQLRTATKAAQTTAEAALAKSAEAQKAAAIAHADTLAKFAAALIEEGRHADAEPAARQCVELRTSNNADTWSVFESHYLLGAALMGRGNVADAERELLATAQGMEPVAAAADVTNRTRYITAVKKLSQLYSATGRKREASEWRRKLDGLPR
jgi:hypothetical protein